MSQRNGHGGATANAALTHPQTPKVRVFKQHPGGVITVRFREPGDAQSALIKLHGRFFGGRRISAAMWDGHTNFAAVKVGLSRKAACFFSGAVPPGLLPRGVHKTASLCPNRAARPRRRCPPPCPQLKETPEEEAARLERYRRELEAREAAAAAEADAAAAEGGDAAGAAEPAGDGS
jgi:hypothetical protein